MSRGNYLPSKEFAPDYLMFYVDYPLFGEDKDLFGGWMDLLKDDIRIPLSTQFVRPVLDWANIDTRVFAESPMLTIFIADNEWSLAVVVAPTVDRSTAEPSYPNLYRRHMENIFKKLTNHLMDAGYDLALRHGPWASTRLKKGG